MKKLVLLMLMTSCYANEFYKFYDAIQQVNLVEFKKLLINQGPLTADQKVKLLKEVDEIINKAKSKLVFFKSEKDMLRALFGYILIYFPYVVSKTGFYKNSDDWQQNAAIFFSIPLSVYAATEIYKGMTLESAYQNLNNGRQIQELIEDAPLMIKFGQT